MCRENKKGGVSLVRPPPPPRRRHRTSSLPLPAPPGGGTAVPPCPHPPPVVRRHHTGCKNHTKTQKGKHFAQTNRDQGGPSRVPLPTLHCDSPTQGVGRGKGCASAKDATREEDPGRVSLLVCKVFLFCPVGSRPDFGRSWGFPTGNSSSLRILREPPPFSETPKPGHVVDSFEKPPPLFYSPNRPPGIQKVDGGTIRGVYFPGKIIFPIHSLARCASFVLFVSFGLSVRPSVCLVRFRSFFLNFCTFASRKEERRAPHGRKRMHIY